MFPLCHQNNGLKSAGRKRDVWIFISFNFIALVFVVCKNLCDWGIFPPASWLQGEAEISLITSVRRQRVTPVKYFWQVRQFCCWPCVPWRWELSRFDPSFVLQLCAMFSSNLVINTILEMNSKSESAVSLLAWRMIMECENKPDVLWVSLGKFHLLCLSNPIRYGLLS